MSTPQEHFTEWYRQYTSLLDDDEIGAAILTRRLAKPIFMAGMEVGYHLTNPESLLKEIQQRAYQLELQLRWLIEKTDRIQQVLAPDFVGNWQERAEVAVASAEKNYEAVYPNQSS